MKTYKSYRRCGPAEVVRVPSDDDEVVRTRRLNDGVESFRRHLAEQGTDDAGLFDPIWVDGHRDQNSNDECA